MLEGRAVQGGPASQAEGAASAVEGEVAATRTEFMATLSLTSNEDVKCTC